jgi:hypothetical protein
MKREEMLKKTFDQVQDFLKFEAHKNKQEENGEWIASYINSLSALNCLFLNKTFEALIAAGSDIEIGAFLDAFGVSVKRTYEKMYEKVPGTI